jgi:beta-carotene 3-hydroxylase
MTLLLCIGAFMLGFAGMEGVAWFTHKYIMHGPLWVLHRDHHVPHEHPLERNDLFAIFFASPAVLLMVLGGGPATPWFWLGAGITGYGIAYVIFHDIIVHRRIKLNYKPASRYMKRIIRAHKVHHKSLGKDDAEAFGFLFALPRYDARDYVPRKAQPPFDMRKTSKQAQQVAAEKPDRQAQQQGA